jgi:hypothetical protein
MRKYIVLLAALGGLVGSAVSVETEIDMDFMQNVEDTNKSLASNIAVKDAPSSIGDAKQLEAMFAQVEAFYARKGGAEDAVDLSKKSKELSAEIIKSAGAKDFETATNKATDLSRTCKSCHSFYKKS